MMKPVTIALAIFLGVCADAYAQNVLTRDIQWNVSKTFNAQDSTWKEEPAVFISYGKTQLEWRDAQGAPIQSFKVIDAVGEWTNAREDGFVQYEITDAQYSGTVSIRREEKEVTIRITIASDPEASYELTIKNHKTL
ncbi:hypothetical protein SAMN04488109_6839 [Chryseolinea serpens]|uniref:Uncharacterized protein n=1 Tax=Chryseolinea serpens TaxID=947013 RepID=A0A1M5XT04_9BACT|nr:hypothetical protein [Chryseolinea serpens]SHI02906.1 hypothetical protein SAMN04488109_6839 [Chryseolinea serpens]